MNALRGLTIAWGLRGWRFFELFLLLSSGGTRSVECDSPWPGCLKVLRCPFTLKAAVASVLQSWGIMTGKTFKNGLGIEQCHLSSRDFISAKMPVKIIEINLFYLVFYMEIIAYLENDMPLWRVQQRKCTWLRKKMIWLRKLSVMK